MTEHDSRESGSIGGQYSSSSQRREAGVGINDSDFTVQNKLYNKNISDNFSKSSTNTGTLGPLWVILAVFIIGALYSIFSHTKDFVSSNSNTDPIFEKTYTAQSKNFEYQVDSPYRLAAIISNNSQNDSSTTFKGNANQFVDFYEKNYKNIFTKDDYLGLMRDYCKNDYCKDIKLPVLRQIAAQHNKQLDFDRVTTKMLSDYWNKADPNNQYDYQPYYIACSAYVDNTSNSCINLQKTYKENYVVRYLNRKEKIVNPSDFEPSKTNH